MQCNIATLTPRQGLVQGMHRAQCSQPYLEKDKDPRNAQTYQRGLSKENAELQEMVPGDCQHFWHVIKNCIEEYSTALELVLWLDENIT